jgi:HD-GYP domain-containing protein (c-di-GMP phosphodiesterase class II)
MKYLPIPIALLEVGKPLPVDVWSSTGQLLLRRGQPIVSEQHRDKLHAFKAGTLMADGLAWQHAYERMVQEMMQRGADVRELAAASMPSEILDSDYVGEQPSGGWLDLQEALRGILYQGGLTINPVARLKGMEERVLALLQRDAEGSLFDLFQALTDTRLGYCATHALLCAVVCELTATKLGLPGPQRKPLIAAALSMNIGMAREQDGMARQNVPINDWQRVLVAEHASRGEEILRAFGVEDALQLDLVRWHHLPDAAEALPGNRTSRQLLHLADVFVARVAARRTRPAQSPVSAVKTMVFGGGGDLGMGSAMAQAVGFYPPGSYVRLASGETAVAVQRGERANSPWVISIAGTDGMPLNHYQCKSTADPRNAIAAALDFEKVKVKVSVDKVRRARERITHTQLPS